MENYIFYSVIGPHAGETVDEILARKQAEVTATGFSLWSARIYNTSIAPLNELTVHDKVTVYCKINLNASEPGKDSLVHQARRMIYPNGEEKEIPDGIETTYRSNDSKYQAYVVGNYQIFSEPQTVDFGQYETTLDDGSKKSYLTRFDEFNRFQNVLGVFNPELEEHCPKEIYAKMELVYPFVVTID